MIYLKCGCESDSAGNCDVCNEHPAIEAEMIHEKWVHYCSKECLYIVYLIQDKNMNKE